MPQATTTLWSIRRLLGEERFFNRSTPTTRRFFRRPALLGLTTGSNDESLMHSGTTDGDMPNGVCQQKDLCATPAVSKEAQSLESNRHGDWPTHRGLLAMETDGPRPRRGDPGPIGTRRSPGHRRVRVPDGFHLTKVESSGATRLARNLVNPRGEWYINPPRVTRLEELSSHIN